MFGKSLSEYIAFQKPILILIAAVWALRLGLSLAGVPVSGAQFVSVTGVLVLGALYYGWAVERRGFGSFKQMYALNLIQGLFSQTLVALAIVLATVNRPGQHLQHPGVLSTRPGHRCIGAAAAARRQDLRPCH